MQYSKNNITQIFYINLDHRKDRRDFMEKQLAGLEIPYQRFSAVAPSISNLTSPDGLYHCFYKRASSRFMSYAETPSLHRRAIGVFGCYISHYLIHQIMAEKNGGDYIIIEDDCLIDAGNLEGLFDAIAQEKIPEGWDIIRNCSKSTDNVQTFNGSHIESRYADNGQAHSHHGGTHFSLFKGKSARKILQFLEGDFVIAIDAAYSTNALNVYHADFGLSPADLGTDIPKINFRGAFYWPRRISKSIWRRLHGL